MKKASLLLITGLLCHTSPVLADTVLGVHAGFDYWAPQSKGVLPTVASCRTFGLMIVISQDTIWH